MINYLEPDFYDLPGHKAIPRNYKKVDSIFGHIDVSVITPYCNTKELFVETFVSVQAQSLQNWEWVIVDDGSTDEESVKRLAFIAAKDERIKVIRQANAGPGAARNTAFRNTSGRYICMLDSDDMIEPTYLEKCIWFLESNPEFAFCNSYSVVFGDLEYLWKTGFERGKAHLQANSSPVISVIRRAAYEDCGGFDESIRFGHEDWDFWLAMAKAGHWGYTIREFLQWIRKRGDGRFEQIMRSGNVNKEFEKMMRRKYQGLEKHFPKIARRYQQPFETIETNSSVINPLAPNTTGRRIMFIIPWMTTGGADRVNLDLIEGLTAKGHDVTVCATLPADHNWEHQFSRFTPDIFILPNILHATDYPRFLAYLIKSRKIDTVVITGSTIGYYLLPYLRAVSPGVAFVDLCHAEEPHWWNGGHPRFGVGYQDVLEFNIVTTRNLSKWMQNRGADGERIRVMYTGVRISSNGHSNEVRAQVRSELNIPKDMPLIVFAGRICEQKRPTMLADIFRVLRNHGLRFQALVIGDGDQRQQLETLLRRYQLANIVQMIGTVSHQRWLDILVASDIFLMPSQYEGISIALLESMAAGVVPVVANVGGHEEVLSPAAGVLISHGENELQQYLDALSRLVLDSTQLRRMSGYCAALAAEKFSWDATIDHFQKLLDEAHRLRANSNRVSITPEFGRELATISLEYMRLGGEVGWLQQLRGSSMMPSQDMSHVSALSMSVLRLAMRLRKHRFTRALIQNKWVQSIGRKVIRRL